MGPYLRSSLQAIVIGSLLAVFLAFFDVLPSARTVIVTDTQIGVTYKGTSRHGVDEFFNIFYAEDTSGQNRFAPPVRLRPKPGSEIDATAAGAACPQGEGPAAFPFTSPVSNTSENCLSLRISRPAGIQPDARLPVIFYIHGGGYILGQASDKLYNPTGLVKQANFNGQPVIYVAINYRLGIFGFASNRALIDGKSANVGLRDQREALEWVRDNIAVFGGDPKRVTTIGQSVGASSIGMHLVSYRGNRGVPFDQAVMMSGASGLNFNIDRDIVAHRTAAVARAVGCTGDPDSESTLQCLRRVPLEKLTNESVSLARSLYPPFGELAFSPTYDGDYVPDRPSVLLRKGQFVKGIPLIAAWETNDGAWYPLPTVNDDAAVAASFETHTPGVSQKSLRRILDAYPPSDFDYLLRPGDNVTTQYYRAAQINRDLWFTCPVVDFSWQYARHSQSEVRLYTNNQTRFEPVWKSIGVPYWRVAHLSDIPFVMNADVAGGGDNSKAQRDLAKKVSGSMAAFAHTGSPSISNGDVLDDWPTAYGGSTKKEGMEQFPQRITVKVIGGIHSGSAAITRKGEVNPSKVQQALEYEKLFERCDIINSNSLQEEIGV